MKQLRQNKVNFFHFPKVGGTSIKKQLEQFDTSKVFFYYNNPFNNNLIMRKINYLNNRSKINKKKVKIVFGHYIASDALFNLDSSTNIVALRHPYEWLGSLYFYWSEKNNQQIPLITFIQKYSLHNFYRTFLGPNPEKVFNIIGFFENYNDFIEKISDELDYNFLSLRENETNIRPKNYTDHLKSDKSFQKIKELMQNNLELYEHLKNV